MMMASPMAGKGYGRLSWFMPGCGYAVGCGDAGCMLPTCFWELFNVAGE